MPPSEVEAGVSQIQTIGIEFTNSGKTQALDVHAVVAGRALLKDVPFSPLYKGSAKDSRTTLRPGGVCEVVGSAILVMLCPEHPV
jgi:hypothetical protein